MPVRIQVTGINDLARTLNLLPIKMRSGMKAEIHAGALEIQKLAIKDAPADNSELRRKIVVIPGDLSQSVVVQVDYAAYMEWGTKSEFRVEQPDIAPYAATFKGPGPKSAGNFNENILAWVKRKQIGVLRQGPATYSRKAAGKKATEQRQKTAAFFIGKSIIQNGVKAHPYFFKNVFLVRDKLFDRMLKLKTK
jgi:hypothetical protein